uniref:Uncharacterized protein n=1 Tax=Timema cristinae TaxID=61476 RepID=A0A7R9D391_TIMCR|nr:unnamed protein product [Timema cristinae]
MPTCAVVPADPLRLPRETEIDILRNLAVVLKPFEYATTEISCEQYVTMSKIISVVNCLKIHLDNLKSNNPAIESVRKRLSAAMRKRFGMGELNSKLAMSTILNPCFKNPAGCAKAIAKLKKLCVEEISSESEEEKAEATDPEYFDFWKTHKELVYGKRKKKRDDSGDYSEELSRHNYVTATSYLELLNSYSNILARKKGELLLRVQRLNTG